MDSHKKLALKYDCEITDLLPVINLIKSKYDIILNNPKYKKHIEIRENLNMEDSDNITKEILDILQPTKSGELFFD